MALIARLRGQIPSAVVVRDHGPAVARLLRRLFGPRADIDDVFQAVFVEVLRSLPAYAGRSQLGTWVHRIALNVAYQEMRGRYRDRDRFSAGEDLEGISSPGDTEADMLRAESVRLLYQGLERLDPKRRIPVILHDLEGLTLREVSETLGRPLQTVASQVKVGREELARWFVAREQPRARAEGRGDAL